nr:transglutaminase-like cysteine peptidase [Photobacterium jeanii]
MASAYATEQNAPEKVTSHQHQLTQTDQQHIHTIRQFYGERAGKRAKAWRLLLQQLSHKSAHNSGSISGQLNQQQQENDKLKSVNQFFNQLEFIDDIVLWGIQDYWAIPQEFIGAGGGDCEDFSIAKYYSLLALGVDDSKLRLVYVKSMSLNQFHMVVAYYPRPEAVPLLLDNIDGEIKPATKRPDLIPIYSFNGSKLWLMKQKGQGQLAGNASRLSAWNEVRQRTEQQDFRRPIINLDE